jgi:hypothetical protein
MPGRQVTLEARLLRVGLLAQTGLGGEQVEFLVNGKPVGTAMTGGDGRAFLRHTPRMRGNQVVTVRLASSKRVESEPATATLACWERRRPILLVDLAALVEEPEAPSLPLPSFPRAVGPANRPAPAAEAAEELKKLTDYFFNVMYLARSDRQGSREESQAWLKQHKLPLGYLVALKGGEEALTELIDRMRAEGWDNLKAGVGRTRDFAEALVSRRLEVVIMPASSRDEDVPKKARVVKDWKEVRRKLQD